MLLQLIFVNWSRICTVLEKRVFSSRGALEVLYDGQCPLCRRTIRVLGCLDLFERLRFIDFRQIDLEAYNHRYNINLTLSELDREMYVLYRGQLYGGFYGYRVMAFWLPALWPIAPLLFIPGIPRVGVGLYRYIARERLKLVRCDETCPLPTDDRIMGGRRTLSLIQPIKLIVMILIASGVSLGSWFWEIEYYPISTFPMFSGRSESGEVSYYKVWARDGSGMRRPAHFEEAIGALAHNRYDGLFFSYCLHAETVRKCDQLLSALGQAYNAKVGPQHKVTAFEVELWKWNFRENPQDAQHVSLVDRIIYDLQTRTVKRL